jgi:hypothetical protein
MSFYGNKYDCRASAALLPQHIVRMQQQYWTRASSTTEKHRPLLLCSSDLSLCCCCCRQQATWGALAQDVRSSILKRHTDVQQGLTETARKRKMRKLASTSSVRTDYISVVIIGGTPPRSTTRQTRGQICQEASKFRYSTQCLVHSSWSYPTK